MKAKTFLGLLIILCFSFPLFSQTGEEMLSQGDELLIDMKDMATAEEALALYRKASGALENKYGALWRISRIHYYIGIHTEKKKEKRRIFSQGVYYGKRAVDLESDKPDGHYWLAVNHGKYGEAKGVLKSLSLVKPIKRALNKVIELDRSYEEGGADKVLGRVFYKVPGIAGGSKKKSREHLEKSKEIGPEDPLTRLYLAETYLKLKETEKARAELEYIMNMEPNPRWLSGVDECKIDAKELLESKKFRKK